VPRNYKELTLLGEFFTLCNLMYRVVSFPLNFTNILAQVQFGSRGPADIKILYIFVDEIL